MSVGNYKKLHEGNSVVYTFKHENESLTLKHISLITYRYQAMEIAIMHTFSHPNLMSASAYIPPSKECPLEAGIIMPTADIDLLDHCITNQSCSDHKSDNLCSEKLGFIYQAMQGLHVLHSHNIIHGDIKPDNIFLFGKRAVLGDFGHSIYLGTEKELITPVIFGSNGYYPIDIVETKESSDPRSIPVRRYGFYTDIWALGLTLYAIICGGGVHLPETGKQTQIEISRQWKRFMDCSFAPHVIKDHLQKNLPDNKFKESLLDLLPRMLAYETQKRPSITEIMNHTLFTSYNGIYPMTGAKIMIKEPKVANHYNDLKSLYIQFDYHIQDERVKRLAKDMARRTHALLPINANNIEDYVWAYIALANLPLQVQFATNYYLVPIMEEIMRSCSYTHYNFTLS